MLQKLRQGRQVQVRPTQGLRQAASGGQRGRLILHIGRQARFLKVSAQPGGGVLFAAKQLPVGVVHQAQFAAQGREAGVGVVFAQEQAVLRAGGKHAVGFASAQGNQVVHQHGHIGCVPPRREGRQAAQAAGHVQCCPEALGCRFFIT